MLTDKLIEKIPDSRYSKEHYQSFIRKNNWKSVKQSKINTYQSKTFENPNIVDIKLIITEHPKTSNKLTKTIGKCEKVGSNINLYSDAKKDENFLNDKNTKITEQEHSFKGYASPYNVKILNSLTLNFSLKILYQELNIN